MEKKLSATAAAPRHRLIDRLIAEAEAAELRGDVGEERRRVVTLMRECGIDGKQAEHIADIVPADYIAANIAHCRRAINGPKGGAFFKCICEDWGHWIGKHADRWRAARAALIESKPDPYAELAVITDDDWPAIVREAIEAIEDHDRRSALLAGIEQHGTPRQSDTLKDIVLAHVRRCAAAANAGEIVTKTYRHGIDAAGRFYTAVA